MAILVEIFFPQENFTEWGGTHPAPFTDGFRKKVFGTFPKDMTILRTFKTVPVF